MSCICCNEESKIYGWKCIAAELAVSIRTALRFAARNVDPLPVRVGHRGPWAHRDALRAWRHRQDLAYTAHLLLERAQASRALPAAAALAEAG